MTEGTYSSLSFYSLFLLPLGRDTIRASSRLPYGVIHIQGKRERERALGLGHVMEDRDYPVGPTGMRSRREI